MPMAEATVTISGATRAALAVLEMCIRDSSDPVRDDVPQAVKDCMDAGIRIKIVTGDTPGTCLLYTSRCV